MTLVERLRELDRAIGGIVSVREAADRIEVLEEALREIEEDLSEAVVHLDEARSATGMAAIKDAMGIARAALKEE